MCMKYTSQYMTLLGLIFQCLVSCARCLPVSHECKLHIKYEASVGLMIYVHYQPSGSHRAI